MFRSIVVGTDGSETADEAVRQAAELAASLGARVHLVCVYEPVPSAQDGPGDVDCTPSPAGSLRPREAVDATLASCGRGVRGRRASRSTSTPSAAIRRTRSSTSPRSAAPT